MSNNKRIAKNALLLYVRMIFMMVVSLYTSRVVLKVLGVEDFGIYNVVGGVITLFGFLNGAMVTDENDWVTGMVVRKMELGEPDASGRRRPVEVEGSDYTIDVDTVIMSLGTSPNPLISSTTEGLETNKWKCIIADETNGKTTKEGVYAGGDAVTGAATVILAMEAGKAGARGIDEYLKGNK